MILNGDRILVEKKRLLLAMLKKPLDMQEELPVPVYRQFHGESIIALGYDMCEYREELAFLRRHSAATIRKQMEALDADKLAYLSNPEQWDSYMDDEKVVLYAFLKTPVILKKENEQNEK